MTESAVLTRFVTASDEDAWKALYSGYREFYGLERYDRVVERVWGWILRGEHSLRGLVATSDDDVPIALADIRTFARPSSGTTGLYLDDLFTSPAARGRGAGSALLARIADLAGDEGLSVVRWITDRENAPARRLYDRHATATRWVTYDLPPSALTS